MFTEKSLRLKCKHWNLGINTIREQHRVPWGANVISMRKEGNLLELSSPDGFCLPTTGVVGESTTFSIQRGLALQKGAFLLKKRKQRVIFKMHKICIFFSTSVVTFSIILL